MSTGTEQPLNAAMSFTYVPAESSLSLATDLTTMSLLDFVGQYTLRLRVYFSQVASVFQEREFKVEIVDPCLTATLTIDASNAVFNADTAVPEVLQFVTYASKRIEWDSTTIVSKSLAPGADPCGALIVEVWQLDAVTSDPVAIDTTVFTVSGLDAAQATLDVQTNDFGKVGIYTLRVVTFYEAYSSLQFSRDFSIEIQDYCFPTSITLTS